MPLLIRWILQAGVPGDQSRQTQREAGKMISRPYQFFPPFRQINSFRMVCELKPWEFGIQGTMEAFTIVLTATQLFYVLAIHSGSRGPVPVERTHAVAAGY